MNYVDVKNEVLEEIYLSATLFTRNPLCSGLGFSSGLRGEKQATNGLSTTPLLSLSYRTKLQKHHHVFKIPLVLT
jgi:hypothetical protein